MIPEAKTELDINVFMGKVQSVDVKLNETSMKIKRDLSVLINSVEKQKPIREHEFRVTQVSTFTVEVELYGVLVNWTPNQVDELLEITGSRNLTNLTPKQKT